MLTLTTWLLGAYLITLRQRRSLRTISCVSGVSTSERGSKAFHSNVRSASTTRLSLELFRNFTWPPTKKIVASISLSTMNPVSVVVTWRDRKERGLASREGGRREIKELAIGEHLWMTNLASGSGGN